MRMWNVDPASLCRKHLLGEHVEMHMFVGHLNKGRRLGRYADGLCERHRIRERHELLASELVARGYNHRSPLPAFDELEEGHVDLRRSERELRGRCAACRRRGAR
jgi:hypothetical protein